MLTSSKILNEIQERESGNNYLKGDSCNDYSNFYKSIDLCREYARYGATKNWYEQGKYVVNMIDSFLTRTLADIYKKIPDLNVEVDERLDVENWDYNDKSLTLAIHTLESFDQQHNQMIDEALPNGIKPVIDQNALNERSKALETLKAYQDQKDIDDFLNSVGKTSKMLLNKFIRKSNSFFHQDSTSAVRNALIDGLSWHKIDLAEEKKYDPKIINAWNNNEEQFKAFQDEEKNNKNTDEKESKTKYNTYNETRQSLKENTKLVKKAPVNIFLDAKKVILSKSCKNLWDIVNAEWIAEKMTATKNELKTRFHDINLDKLESDKDKKHIYYEVWVKKTGLIYYVMEQQDDFLQKPQKPKIKLKRFYPYTPLVFEKSTTDYGKFPLSLITKIHRQQEAINKRRQVESEIVAQTPTIYMLNTNEDLAKEYKELLANPKAGAIIPMKNRANNDQPFLSPIQKAGLDPNILITHSDYIQDFPVPLIA